MPGLPTVFDKYFTNNAVEEGDMEKYHMGCHPRTARKKKKNQKTGPNIGMVTDISLHGSFSGFALEPCFQLPSLHYQIDWREPASGLAAMGT